MLVTPLTLMTTQKSCFWNMLQICSNTYCCWHCWQHGNLGFEICFTDVQRLTAVDAVDTVDIKKFVKNIFFSPVLCCWHRWHCWHHIHLVFEICFKDVQRLTAIDTVDITKFRNNTFFHQSFAVDAVDTVDNKEILFLKYATKMFKDLLLLTPLTLLTTR